MKRLLIICLAVILALVGNLLVLPAQPAMAAYKEVIKLDGTNGKFGTSVAISGDTIVVGAPTQGINEGKADVFVRSGGVWTLQQTLSSTITGIGYTGTRWFGASVAIDGDTIVVGAPRDDDEGNNAGAAWVFVRSGGAWTEQQQLTASDGEASDFFGHSVSISGDRIVVGSYGDDDNGSGAGAAYVFVRSSSTWTEQQKLTASDGETGDIFGRSVGISGIRIVVGAKGDDTDTGAAYVFKLISGVWTERQKLTASDADDYDDFGTSVAIDGGTIVVGIDKTGASKGSAYVFALKTMAPIPIPDEWEWWYQ